MRLPNRDADACDGVSRENPFGDTVPNFLEKLRIGREHRGRLTIQCPIVDDGLDGRFNMPLVPHGDVDFDRLRVLTLVWKDADARVKAHGAEGDRFTGRHGRNVPGAR